LKSDVSLEEALTQRRSIRSYSKDSLSLEQIGQLSWAAQGITDGDGLRTAPSAGALYPLEIYWVIERVAKLGRGVYRYRPAGHLLETVAIGERVHALAHAALGQSAIHDAAAVLVIAAVYERTTVKYGSRGRQYVHYEAGHAAQNVLLQTVALDCGAVVIGAFDDGSVHKTLGSPADEEPLYLITIGRK
jgi:SagB-type dehydrogenase family enzyme